MNTQSLLSSALLLGLHLALPLRAQAPAFRASEVSAGGAFTCALSAEQRAYCWGNNWLGQLGNGTRETHMRPTLVSGERSFRTIAAGAGHACAIGTDSLTYCWGAIALGPAAGDSAGSICAAPSWRAPCARTPQLLPGAPRFQSIASGENGSCGLTAAGELHCWFAGNPTPTRVEAPPLAAVFISRNSIREGHGVCGLSRDGQAYCSEEARPAEDDPSCAQCTIGPLAPVAGNTRFASLAPGANRVCAISPEGQPFCWGRGFYGEFGPNPQQICRWAHGSVPCSEEPAPVATSISFKSLVTGDSFLCGLDAAGRAACWGQNERGEAGRGSTRGALDSVAPVAGALRFRSLSAGNHHVCGITTQGLVACWGSNEDGELGRRGITRTCFFYEGDGDDGRECDVGLTPGLVAPPTPIAGRTAAPLVPVLIPVNPGSPTGFAFSPRSDLVAVVDTAVTLWAAQTGARVRQLEGRASHRVAINPGGRLLAAITGDSISVWDLQTGKQSAKIVSNESEERILGLAFQGADSLVVLTRDSVVVRALGTGRVVRKTTLRGASGSAVLSPDGRVAVVETEQGVAAYHMVRGTRLWSVRMSVFEDQIAFSADGSTVAVLQSTDSVSVLSAATGRRLAALRSPHPLLSIALSPDGRVLATGSNRRVRFYSVPSGRLLGSDDRHAASTAMVFAPDGKRFATRTGHSILVSHFRFARP